VDIECPGDSPGARALPKPLGGFRALVLVELGLRPNLAPQAFAALLPRFWPLGRRGILRPDLCLAASIRDSRREMRECTLWHGKALSMLTGKALAKAIMKIGEEHAAIKADLKRLRPSLAQLRGPQRDALKSLIEEYLPKEAMWLRKPLTIRKTSQDYLAEAEYLRAAAHSGTEHRFRG
jgi:hypothetical protein